jgi:glycosyltransferase involved in cell wall biosynthesis
MAVVRVGLVHDYLIEFGGAERVLAALHGIWPEAPIYTAFFRPERFAHVPEVFAGAKIVTTWIDRMPLADRFVSPLRFFAPVLFENLDLGDFDLVISSCNTYSAKAIITRPETVHLSYIHTPPRALYGYDETARWRRSLWKRVLAAPLTVGLRIHDYLSAQRPDYLIANSETTRARIGKFYRREARVIHPPVMARKIIEHARDHPPKRSGYFLAVGRFLPPKRLDLAIKACGELGLPLVVIGSGLEEPRMRRLAGGRAEFAGEVSDEELWDYYAGATAVIFSAQDEDFGIVPVEAMAAGTPVIALDQGGVRETVLAGKTGVFFPEPNAASLIKVLKDFDPDDFDPRRCRRQALKFDETVFAEKIRRLVKEVASS